MRVHVPLRRLVLPIRLGLAVALVAIIAGGASLRPVAAQSTPAAGATVPTITVTGTGTITVTPDIAHVTVGVVTNETTLAKAQSEATTSAQAVLDTATGAGIDKKDIQTVDYSVDVIAQTDDNGNQIGVQGYRVTNAMTITVRDIDSVGSVLDKLVAAGANTVYGVSFDVSDPTAATAQARQAATKDASDKADAYAKGLGVQIIGVQSMTETSAPQPLSQEASYARAAPAAASAPVPVSAGSAQISVTIEVVYQVAPGA